MVQKRNLKAWIKEPEDKRDFPFKTSLKVEDLPESVDLREYASAIENQGSLGSCTACASVALLEYLDKKNDNNFTNLSKLFVYYNVRSDQGTVSFDSGATIRGVLRAIAKKGACPETMHPYKIRNYKMKPSQACYTEGLKHQILYYLKLYSLDDIRQALASEFPVVCGIDLFESFESIEVEKTGYVPIPTDEENKIGGHAISILGYTPEYFICRNSWGKDWGENGYFFLKPEYLEKYGADFWTVTLAEIP